MQVGAAWLIIEPIYLQDHFVVVYSLDYFETLVPLCYIPLLSFEPNSYDLNYDANYSSIRLPDSNL